MPQSDISNWLQFAIQQMAAESYLDGFAFSNTSEIIRRLEFGNNNSMALGLTNPNDDPDLLGKTRFVDLAGVPNAAQLTGSAQAFVARYQIVDHHANNSTGFSATIMLDTITGEYTLSFRSTEYRNQSQGGDYQRDGANGLTLIGADGEIVTKGFAFGQLAAMEDYFNDLKEGRLSDGSLDLALRQHLQNGGKINVTGYSLGAHLATVFTEMHATEVIHTYTFNGPGRGTFNVALPSEAAEAQRMSQMITKLTQVLLDPDAGLPTPRPPDDQLPFGYILAKNAQQADPTFNPFAEGNPANIYSDARYLWAKEVVSAQYGPLSAAASDISRTDGAFSLITQIVGHATQGDTEYVANSGNHAAETRVYIEDQPNLDGFGGFFGSGDFGTTHSITLIVDSLATQELFQTIAPALAQSDIEAILAASSNQQASGFIGTSGVAEGNSLENALDALDRLFVPNYTPTPSGRQTGDFGSLAFRNPFYENLAAVKTALAGATVTIEPFVEMGMMAGKPKALPLLTADQVMAEAQQDTDRGLAFRYSLKALNPFAGIGADYQGLGHASNGALTLVDPATGFGDLTEQYLTDRAAFLEAKIELNLVNATTSGDSIYYKDFVGEGYEIVTGSILTTDQRFLFGSDNDDPPLVGDSAEDHLYGGGGNDLLDGQEGRDYLEGNAGNDVLLGGAGRDMLLGQQDNDILEGGDDEDRLTGGLDADELRGGAGTDVYYVRSGEGQDTIVDSDGLGLIELNQRLLAGGVRKPTEVAQTYTSPDGQFRYVRSGSTLTITHQQSSEDRIVVGSIMRMNRERKAA